MKYGTWALALIAFGLCGSVGWLVGRGDRPAPVVSIPDPTTFEVRPFERVNPISVSDEEARKRVMQLIDLKALGEAPEIRTPIQIDGLECEVLKPLVVEQVPDDLAYEAGVLMMPYAEANAAPSVPLPFLVHRFDLWMLLFTCTPKLSGGFDTAEPALKQRSPRECEECPVHPEVDTLEYRPTDGKKGDYEKFHNRPI